MPRILILVALLVGLVPGQESEAGNAFRDRAGVMFKEALRSREAHATLGRLVKTAPKRLSGSPGAEAAVRFGLAEMERIGLKNVRREEFMVPRWVRGSWCDVRVTSGADDLVPFRAAALGGSVGTPAAGLSAEVIEVLSFGQLRALGSRAKGRIIFFNRPFDLGATSTGTGYGLAVDQRALGAIEAAKAGAVGTIVRSVSSEPDDEPHTGAMNYEDGVTRIPAAALGVQSAERLHALLLANPSLTLRLAQDCATLDPVLSANVVGEIPGTSAPAEVVLIGAHLDAWDLGEGAHDDGAGCAHVLEAARLILMSGVPPKRTIRCVLYMNEENGLAGGRDYAARHEQKLAQHVLAIESDSGGLAPRGFTTNGGAHAIEAMKPIADTLSAFDLGPVKPGQGGADISTLAPAGVPLMALHTAGDRYFDLHHTARDVFESVHPRELCLGAAALAIMAFGVADLEVELPRVPAGK